LAQHITLKGDILNKIDVEGIHILNITSLYNTVSNQNGEFLIRVAVHDTLLFSSINFKLEEIIITKKIYKQEKLEITLEKMVNQLDEVHIGNTLSGNLAADLKNIKTKKKLDFEDVGIPGFKGVPKEKIVPVVVAAIPTQINIEALYKHFTGYYKKLRTKRKWTSENYVIAKIINFYGAPFFEEAYKIPQNRVYDFLLFCIETTSLKSDYNKQNFAGVLTIFKEKSKQYVSRISLAN
jgi:hypothetical protein